MSKTQEKELTPEFILMDTLHKIANISANMGTNTHQALNNYHALINYLEDCLDFWLPFYPALVKERDEFEAELKKTKEENPNFSKKDYNYNRKRYRFYVKLLNTMGLFLRAEVRGV